MPEAGVPLARAFARLTIDVADAGGSVQSAVRKAGESGQKEAESQAGKIKDKFKQGLEFGAGFYGGEALLRGAAEGIKSVIESADQLKERTENVDRVFGESSSTVLKFGQDAAKSYGLSAVSADQLSVKLGALFTNLGVGQGEAAKMSEKLVGLAADLAAFNHTDTASAEQALQNALSGRTQSLKQYGIVVDSVTIQQQAMKDGLIHTVNDALTPAARAQAAYEVILQRSKVQQGQFERSSGSLAEQTKILQAEVTDASAVVGEKLVPVLVDGAKGLQSMGRAGGDVVKFFQNNEAASIALAGVLGASVIPKLTELTITAEQFVQTNIAAAFASGAGGIRAMGAALLANPELYGLAAALAAAGVAVELFSHQEHAAKVDVQGLTDAVKEQDSVGGSALYDQIIKQFNEQDIANKGENVLEYLRRYKVNVAEIIQDLTTGNLYGPGGAAALIQPIINDPSVSQSTQATLIRFFTKIAGGIGSARDAEKALQEQDAATKAQLGKTPEGRFVQFMQGVTKAQNDLTASAKTNNQTISGQIDLLKTYSAQADITAASIQKSILTNIKTLAGEGENLKTLSANGVDGDFIKKLVAEGPEYVAAVASASKQVQLQLSQQFAAGQTQLVHTSDEAARAELPKAAQTVANAAQLQLDAQAAAIKTKFFTAVQGAVNQARTIAGDGGRDTANAFGARGESGRNTVLQSFLKTLPDPVRIAAQSALGIATDAGGKLPANLAAAINAHIPKASAAAEAMRIAVQAKIDALHGKTLDVITQDNASAALQTITKNIQTLEAYNNTLKASRIGAADGGFVSGPGGPRDDVIPAWLSNEEHITNAASANVNRALLAWMDQNPGSRVPGFADGGPVVDQLATHPFVQSFADALTGGSLAALVSGVSGGASHSQSVAAWGPEILRALALVGAPAAWLPLEEIIMGKESGGSTTAVNPIADAAGHAIGLMQMKLGTFMAHALPGMTDIYNGFDQLVSSIRYQIADWGGPANIPGVVSGSYGGYDHGGILPPRGVAVNMSDQPEMVRSKTQEDGLANRLDKLISQNASLLRLAASQPDAFASALNGVSKTSRLAARTGSRI